MNILLGVTGGVSAYKAAELLRLLRKEGYEVRVVMTQRAQSFVSTLTFQALSAHPVYTDLFSQETPSAMDHIELSRWADFILIAPASANFMAKLAQGCAEDLLTTLCLAAKVPVAIAPAMNSQMWLNAATQDNLKRLQQRGVICYGPGEGLQACGEEGLGRLLEPVELLAAINNQFQPCSLLVGKAVLITAGPTREKIDPIRYLTNRSTGRMGQVLAEAAAKQGARVTLITGALPTAHSPSSSSSSQASLETIHIETAQQMRAAVLSRLEQCDIFISAAAVSDYQLDTAFTKKIKKKEPVLKLEFVRTPDILAEVAASQNRPSFVVGFCAETENLVERAKEKLTNKHLDMIVANYVNESRGFGDSETELLVLEKDKAVKQLGKANKLILAARLIEWITGAFVRKKASKSL